MSKRERRLHCQLLIVIPFDSICLNTCPKDNLLGPYTRVLQKPMDTRLWFWISAEDIDCTAVMSWVVCLLSIAVPTSSRIPPRIHFLFLSILAICLWPPGYWCAACRVNTCWQLHLCLHMLSQNLNTCHLKLMALLICGARVWVKLPTWSSLIFQIFFTWGRL